MSFEILILDNHPMIVDCYVNLLRQDELFKEQPNFTKCYNCEQAINEINLKSKQDINIDLILLDISIPPFKNTAIMNGVDIALHLKSEFKKCKIIFFTMYVESIMIDRIFREIKPEGFIAKCEIDFELFSIIIKKVISGETFYSQMIIDARIDIFKKNIRWDSHDCKILTLLAQGIKTTDLPNYIMLSKSAIEKRKANIKDQLLGGRGSDRDLTDALKNLGMIK